MDVLRIKDEKQQCLTLKGRVRLSYTSVRGNIKILVWVNKTPFKYIYRN